MWISSTSSCRIWASQSSRLPRFGFVRPSSECTNSCAVAAGHPPSPRPQRCDDHALYMQHASTFRPHLRLCTLMYVPACVLRSRMQWLSMPCATQQAIRIPGAMSADLRSEAFLAASMQLCFARRCLMQQQPRSCSCIRAPEASRSAGCGLCGSGPDRRAAWPPAPASAAPARRPTLERKGSC